MGGSDGSHTIARTPSSDPPFFGRGQFQKDEKRYDGMLGWKMRPNKEMGIGIKTEVKDDSEGQWET